ncbi:MAG TPA: WecB/TagA/CpsF family glycosyltransferase [Candidatus Peribacteraceae bacterium]|nr:WecB/TagA/CpsF family glycosyltransferase [Candidatus Peribacteraceae bacterium]
MSRIVILGVPVDPLTRGEAVARLQSMLSSAGQHHVMTPNSEMLVAASHDEAFRSVLQKSDLNIADSQGLVWMSRLIGQSLPERVTGVDTVTDLCASLSKDHPVFLLGAAPGIAEKTADVLRVRNPHLTIVGTFAGSPKENDAMEIIRRIADAKPHLLLVAYGAPAQDLWIHEHLAKLPSVRVAMGVGGTFDFIAGTQIRAPKMLQSLGLEWLWRLMREPRRFTRILNAVVVFPWLAFRYRSGLPRAEVR